MKAGGKGAEGTKSQAISVRVTAEQLREIEKAIHALWKDAPVTRSSAIVALALRGARAVERGEK